jgi:hypothetical protein
VPGILISYRRGDADATAHRIHEMLTQRYGRGAVFIDVDAIPYGYDFRKHITTVLQEIDVMLAIVGRDWLKEIEARESGSKVDYVRLEIETALERNIPVIPVLVEGANMPDELQLTGKLEDFTYRNAARVDVGQDFRVHVERLMQQIDRLLGLSPPQLKDQADASSKTHKFEPPSEPPSETFSATIDRIFGADLHHLRFLLSIIFLLAAALTFGKALNQDYPLLDTESIKTTILASALGSIAVGFFFRITWIGHALTIIIHVSAFLAADSFSRMIATSANHSFDGYPEWLRYLLLVGPFCSSLLGLYFLRPQSQTSERHG